MKRAQLLEKKGLERSIVSYIYMGFLTSLDFDQVIFIFDNVRERIIKLCSEF